MSGTLPQNNKRERQNSERSLQTLETRTEAEADLYERLNEVLTTQIKFVDRNIGNNDVKKDDSDDGIYLFKDSQQRVSSKDLLQYETKLNLQSHTKQKKPNLRKRRLEDDIDSDDESTKLKSVAVSFDWVINGKN